MSRYTLQRTAGMIAIGLAVAPALATAGREASEPDPATTSMARILHRAVNENGLPGVSAIVHQQGNVIFHGAAGFADLEHQVPASKDTVFPIASVTKSFTALAILQLEEQGKLSLGDPLSKHLTDYEGPAKAVTVSQLLNHTAGVFNYLEEQKDTALVDAMATSPADVVSIFQEHPLLYEPGTAYRYSNSHYVLLGRIIEKVSGITYEEYLKAKIFEPFAMEDTRVFTAEAIIHGRARGYFFANGTVIRAREHGDWIAFAAGNILSTTGDMLAYRLATWNPALVSGQVRSKMTKVLPLPDGGRMTYAPGGLMVDQVDNFGKRVWHNGFIDGYSSDYTYFPDHDLTVIVLSNGMYFPRDSAGNISRRLARAALGIPEPEIEDLALPADVLDPYTGSYAIGEWIIELRIDDGRLAYDDEIAAGQVATNHLKAQGNDRFVPVGDDAQTIQFTRQDGVISGFVVVRDGQTIATASRR